MYELCIHMNNKSSCFLLNSTVMTSHPTQAHIILKHIILNKGVYSRVKENQCLIQYSEELSCCWFSGAETDLGRTWERQTGCRDYRRYMWEDIWNNMKKRARTLQLKILHGVHLSLDRLSKFMSTTSSLCHKGKLNPSSLTHRLWCHHTL